MPQSHDDDWTYLRRLLITAVVVALAYVAWRISGILLLLFAAILVATLLTGLSEALATRTSISLHWALAIVVAGLAVLLGGFFTFFGTQLAAQVVEVWSRVPEALDAAGKRFDITDASGRLTDAFSSTSGGQLASRAASMGYTLVGVLADLVLMIVTAIYLAADPNLYRRGLVKLFPPSQHERVTDALSATAAALRLWFLGQLVSMVLVGILCAIAFSLIGVPMPIGLGVIAGITNFVPLVGPIVGAIPAILFAFTEGTATVLWTIAAILVIQQVEGYVIMPLVQRRAVDVPPAVVLFAIAIFAILFGGLGIVLAVPLAVAVMVMVQILWIRETLGERTTVAGEKQVGR
jgi:predicted PurR-regulated permease PerM